jgi:hypothetical protein
MSARYQQYLPQEPVVMPYSGASPVPSNMPMPVRSSTGHAIDIDINGYQQLQSQLWIQMIQHRMKVM